MGQSGGSVYEAEYLLFVEDSPKPGGDGIGDVYLLEDLNNDGYISDDWPDYLNNPGPILNNSVAGYRIDGKCIDVYINQASISNPTYSYFTWATDNEDPNLDQAPHTDRSNNYWDIDLLKADLSIVKYDSQDPVDPGASLTYTLTVTNHGPHDAENVNVTDTLPAEVTFDSAVPTPNGNSGSTYWWTYSSLDVGESEIITINVTVDSGATGDITNIAHVYNDTYDPVLYNNEYSEETNISPMFTLSVYINGNGSVVKDPDQSFYVYGTVVELTAVADVGWSFAGWSGDLSGSVNPENITMDGDKVVTATFSEDCYILDVIVVGNGSVLKNPDQSCYNYGDVVELTAVADVGWSFAGWSGDLSGSVNPENITMDGDKVVTATFSEDCYILDVIVVGNGSVLKNPDQSCYNYGDVVELTAVADVGWSFAGWSGDLSGSVNPENITMDGNKLVTASFTQPSYIYNLTIIIVGNGTVDLSPPGGHYLCGTTVTMTANADPCWEFAGWSGAVSGMTNPETIYMDGNKLVTATFKEGWLCEIMINGTLPRPTPKRLDINMKDWVYFGEKATASDGVDSEDLPYPGTPPAPYVAGWFMTEFVEPYDELERDIRYYPEVAPNDKIWDLWVETDTAGNGNTVDVYMNWSSIGLVCDEYDYVILRDYLSGDTLVDMRAVSTFMFIADHGMGYHFEIVCGWNHCPVAVDDYYTAIWGVPLIVDAPGVLANDHDDEGDPFTAAKKSDPAHGTVVLNANGSFEYIPNGIWYSTPTDPYDSFTYELLDGPYCHNEATVYIQVCRSVHLDVAFGWNLISLPAQEFDYDKTNFVIEYPMGSDTYYSWAEATDLITGWILDFTYGWTGGNSGVYVDEPLLQPGEGYWLWADEPCTLIMYSCAGEDNHITTFDDGEGWYLVGAPYMYDLARWQMRIHYNALYYNWWDASHAPVNAILYYLYDWDRPVQNYVLSDPAHFFESGVGYWMYIYEPCSLKKL